MPKQVSASTIATTGVGRPDYTNGISEIKRGETYPQFEPRPSVEKYKIFFACFGSAMLLNGTGVATGSPVALVLGVNTIQVTGAGTFTVTLPAGAFGVATSGTATLTVSPHALVPGPNIVDTGITIGNFTITLVGAAALGPGDTAHYADIETFLPTPYTSPAGLVGDFREWFFACSQDVEFNMLMDGILPLVMSIEGGNMVHQYEQIVWGKTTLLDPTSSLTHTWDFYVTNRGPLPLVGSAHVTVVLAVPEV